MVGNMAAKKAVPVGQYRRPAQGLKKERWGEGYRVRTHARVDGARGTFTTCHLVTAGSTPQDRRHGRYHPADEVECEETDISQ